VRTLSEFLAFKKLGITRSGAATNAIIISDAKKLFGDEKID
jgi:hypothetical protein